LKLELFNKLYSHVYDIISIVKKWYNEKHVITFAPFPKLNYIIKVNIFIHKNNNSVIVKKKKKNSDCDMINPSHFL